MKFYHYFVIISAYVIYNCNLLMIFAYLIRSYLVMIIKVLFIFLCKFLLIC